VRGLHAQRPPHAQSKLVRVLQGAALDVAVDLRAGSPTYGEHVAVTLTADGGEQFYIPAGFAHGFLTLADATVLSYKLSAFHTPEAEVGVAWDDPDLAIAWPLGGREPILSDRDRGLPRLAESRLTL
jgi:dTDP-4-dehydrorhamnose 3,5-epimerase